jgi:hypothetical protein
MNAAATKLPNEMGPIHFVGIGGIGMSGIAEVLLNHGFTVQGSDLKASPITERLEAKGARIFIGQSADNLEGAEVVVISSAIKRGNPELDAARTKNLPVVRRAEMLACDGIAPGRRPWRNGGATQGGRHGEALSRGPPRGAALRQPRAGDHRRGDQGLRGGLRPAAVPSRRGKRGGRLL